MIEVIWWLPTVQSICADSPWFMSDTRVVISLLIWRFSEETTTGDTAAPNSGLAVTAPLGKVVTFVA